MKEGRQLIEIRRRPAAKSAMLFLHGFTGDSDQTWDRFPWLMAAEESMQNWDILSLGYNTSFLPGTRGIWSADPELPILATLFRTQLDILPLSEYAELAVIAHSMGGLVAQQALVTNTELTTRVRYLFLFGTPSAGLRKAAFIWSLVGHVVGEQVHNMAAGGEFVTQLRSRWSAEFGDNPPFRLYAIAGDKDQFVTPDSSLRPFAPKFQRVVAGDHLSMVKPRDQKADVVRLLVSGLTRSTEPSGPSSPLRVAAEVGAVAPQGMAIAEAAAAGREEFTTQPQVVEAALALDRDNKRADAIALLEKYQHLGTDVKGTLAGRIKRRWLQDGDQGDAHWALGLYGSALRVAMAAPETQETIEQVFYHAINVAFLDQVAFDRPEEARQMANLALEHVKKKTPPDIWSVATEAEAHLYLGDYPKALGKYREAVAMKAESWKLISAGQQAQQIAGKLGNKDLQQELKTVFDPRPKRVGGIFVSYSHQNTAWRDKLTLMLSPLLTEHDKLELWADDRIPPGADWLKEITTALSTCRVAVLLVSAEFLASEFIRSRELPAIFDAVDRGEVRLIWLYLSYSLYEETRLSKYEAAHDPIRPLDEMIEIEQRKVLKDVAIKIKEAVFS